MAGSIICGVDDSESAKGAARVARGLSARLGMRLLFVRVVEDGSSTVRISAIAERLQHLAEGTTDVDCGAHWLVEVGHPADRLVAAAAAEEASLIVVGSSGPRSSLLGSISAEISRRAPCPVVVVAPGADGCLVNGRGETQSASGYGRTDSTPKTTGFPGGSNGYTEIDASPPDYDGGIVRFSLGSRAIGS